MLRESKSLEEFSDRKLVFGGGLRHRVYRSTAGAKAPAGKSMSHTQCRGKAQAETGDRPGMIQKNDDIKSKEPRKTKSIL